MLPSLARQDQDVSHWSRCCQVKMKVPLYSGRRPPTLPSSRCGIVNKIGNANTTATATTTSTHPRIEPSSPLSAALCLTSSPPCCRLRETSRRFNSNWRCQSHCRPESISTSSLPFVSLLFVFTFVFFFLCPFDVGRDGNVIGPIMAQAQSDADKFCKSPMHIFLLRALFVYLFVLSVLPRHGKINFFFHGC